jgi:hypothetical protein
MNPELFSAAMLALKWHPLSFPLAMTVQAAQSAREVHSRQHSAQANTSGR